MKYLIPAIRFKIFMTLILGLVYPFMITGISQTIFPLEANGKLMTRGGQVVGAAMIGQNFERAEYFWPRPSAIGYNPLPSGGSNLGQISQALKATVDERKAKLKAAHPEQTTEPPQDLIFASGSGLDPHISIAAAEYQLSRIAKARNLNLEQIKKLVSEASEGRQLGLLGEPTVNVLRLNLALDQSQGITSAPLFVPPPEPAPAAPPPPEETTTK